MRPVAPRIHGVDETTLAEDDERYKPITVGIAPLGPGVVQYVTRWRPSKDDIACLMEGADVFVMLTCREGTFPPISAEVGWPAQAPEGEGGAGGGG